MIHAKQWHYSLQRLPVASFHSFYMKKSKGFFQYHSTFRKQRALRLILHAEGKEIFYPVYQAFQPQDLPKAFQFFKDISVIHDIPGIPVIHGIPAFQALLHVPVLPVPYSVSSTSRDSTHYSFTAFFNQNANSTHRLVSTRNSIEYQSRTIHHYKHYILQRKGDVAIWVRMTLSVK